MSKRKLRLVLTSLDYETVDVTVSQVLKTLEGSKASLVSEVTIIPVFVDEVTGRRTFVRRIITPALDDKTVAKLAQLVLPSTVKVKIFEN